MEVTWDQEEAQAHNLLGSGPSPLVLLCQGVTGDFALPKHWHQGEANFRGVG